MLVLLLCFPALVWAANSSCPPILKAAGMSDDFGYHVGHAIHSLSLRTLRKFEPSVTENNRIPTINMDLKSDDAVLPYAPERNGPGSEMFHSEGMKILDEVLSHMDSSSYDIKFFSTLEKVVHAFHMEEMWMMALHQYQKLKANPPSSQVCQCAMDTENNGIMKMIRFSALAMREPMLIYGGESQKSEAGPVKRGYDVHYSIGRKKRNVEAALRNEKSSTNDDSPGKQEPVRRGYTFQFGRKKRSTETDLKISKVASPHFEKQQPELAQTPSNRGYYFHIGRKKRSAVVEKEESNINDNPSANQEPVRRGYTFHYPAKKRSTEIELSNAARHSVDDPDGETFSDRGYFIRRKKRESGGCESCSANEAAAAMPKKDSTQRDYEFKDQHAYPLGYQHRLNPADKFLLQKDDAMPKLVDATSWEKWKEIAKMNPQEDFDTALFLYCALH